MTAFTEDGTDYDFDEDEWPDAANAGAAQEPLEPDADPNADPNQDSVQGWLARIGCDSSVQRAFREQKLREMRQVLRLTDRELKEDVGIIAKGDRMTILDAIQEHPLTGGGGAGAVPRARGAAEEVPNEAAKEEEARRELFPPGLSASQISERVPSGKMNDPLVHCLVVRDRSGMMKRLNPEYYLYLQGRRSRSETLLLIAKKRVSTRGTVYEIYNGEHKGPNRQAILELKCSNSNAEYTLLNSADPTEELGGALYEKPSFGTHMKEGAQPRKFQVILPAVGENQLPIPHNVNPNDPRHGMVSQITHGNVREGSTVLARKDPVFENGNYRLNFHGRVTIPSVKNLQLVNPLDVNDVICQFGKVGEERFHLDFKGPMNARMAFAIALSQFNY